MKPKMSSFILSTILFIETESDMSPRPSAHHVMRRLRNMYYLDISNHEWLLNVSNYCIYSTKIQKQY